MSLEAGRRTGRERLLAAGFLAGAALAVTVWRGDEAERRRGDDFARRFALDERKPEWPAQARVQSTWDLALGTMADAAAEDATASVRWNALSFDERQVWLEAQARMGEEIGAARDLALHALAARPGWAFHREAIGTLTYLEARRRDMAGAATAAGKWSRALELAGAAAPGFDGSFTLLAGACLETWGSLDEATRARARGFLSRAFLDDAFARRAFLTARSALSESEAAALVPERASSLRAARESLGRDADAAEAAALLKRETSARARESAAALSRLERSVARGDDRDALVAAREWYYLAPLRDRDTDAGRREAERALALWPPQVSEGWRSDPRADMVRFLAEGRLAEGARGAVSRGIAAFPDAPEPVRALGRLFAGDRYGWERLLRESETVGSFEWTPFLTALARFEREGGRPDAAARAIGMLAGPALEECAVLRERREIARARRDEGEAAHLAARLESARAASWRAAESATAPAVSLCVDPDADGASVLRVHVRTNRPAIVAWGWNGGRSDWHLVSGEETLRVPLAGVAAGRAALSIQVVAGAGRIEGLSVTRESAPASSSAVAAAAAPSVTARTTGSAGIEKLNSTSP